MAIALQPMAPGLQGAKIISKYGATNLIPALKHFLGFRLSSNSLSPHHLFNVWHQFTLHHCPFPFAPDEECKCDVICAKPATFDGQHIMCEAIFDMVLFLESPDVICHFLSCLSAVTDLLHSILRLLCRACAGHFPAAKPFAGPIPISAGLHRAFYPVLCPAFKNKWFLYKVSQYPL